MVRQRQEPLTSPADGACAAGPRTAAIADASPGPPEPLASPSAFCLASPSAARRPLSKSDAWSCQPADAAVMDAARAAVTASALSVLFRIGLSYFGRVAVLRSGPALEIGGRRHANHVETGVDEVNLTRHASRQVTKQVQCRAADMVELDRFLEWCVGFG